jgi:L-threonylcarbamoyladenylate synthase
LHTILTADSNGIDRVAEVLVNGEIAIFPTETLYALGGNAYDDSVVAKIYICKGRPRSKPLSVCYSSFDKVYEDLEVDKKAEILAKKFLPGPLTMILKRRIGTRISKLCSFKFETVGIRIPANKVAIDLLKKLPFPLTAPSANQSSQPSAITADQASDSLKTEKDLIVLDGGKCSVGIESTIVDLIQNKIIRIGAIPPEEIISIID